MNITSPLKQQQEYLRSKGVAEFKPGTGFTENWLTAMHMNWYEGMSNSRSRVINERTHDRNRQIYDEVGKTIPAKEFKGFKTGGGGWQGVDWKHLALHAKNKYGMDIKTDDEIMVDIRKDLSYYRTHAEDVFQRASIPGKIGQFSGYAQTDALDPLIAPTFLIGYGQAAVSAKFLATVSKTALKIGAAEGIAEAARQTVVYDWKQDVGAEYGLKDSVTAVLVTALATGSIGATAQAASLGIRKLANRASGNTTQQFAKDKLNHIADELMEASKLETDALKAAQKIEEAVKRQDEIVLKRYGKWRQDGLSDWKPVKTAETPAPKIPDFEGRTLKAVQFGKKATPEEVVELKRLHAESLEKQKSMGNMKELIKDKSKLKELEDEIQIGATLKEAWQAAEGRKFPGPEVSNVTQSEPGIDFTSIHDDVIDTAADDILKRKPDTAIPIDETGQQVAKASDVIKRESDKFELANKMKECLV